MCPGFHESMKIRTKMELRRALLTFALLPACITLAACSSDVTDPGTESGGSTNSGGGGAVGGATGGTGTGGSSAGVGGAFAGGAAGSGTGGSSAGSAGNSGGTAGLGGAGTGGSAGGAGGSAGAAGSGGAGPTTGSVEDDGTDCAVGTLPDAGGLPTNSKLPDPFKKLDGTTITTKAEWRCRRAEIKAQAERYVYGAKGPKPAMVTGTVSSTSITVNVTDGPEQTSFSASVELPQGQGPFPVFVSVGTGAFGEFSHSNLVKSEGVAVIKYDPYDAGAEGTGRQNKAGAFYDIYGSDSDTGILVAWAWGVSRIIDVIQQADGSILKKDAFGAGGCSRFGKGALAVGAFDQRIALTVPFESGTAGVPIYRGIPGEGAQGLQNAYNEQPWFGDAFSSFYGSPTKAPIDTHEILAMIAPRGLLILDNPHITNLGPKSAHVAALAGAEVYKALGAGENISYISNVTNGDHCSNSRPEHQTALRAAVKKFLLKTGNDPGTIDAHPQDTGNLAEWRDWTTPTLD